MANKTIFVVTKVSAEGNFIVVDSAFQKEQDAEDRVTELQEQDATQQCCYEATILK